MARDAMDGDARRNDVTYDSSVSTPHAESGLGELEIVDGCESVDGTVGVTWLEGVGVTEDSVGDGTVRDDGVVSDEGVRSDGDRTEEDIEGPETDGVEIEGIGEGPGIDSVGDCAEESSTLEGVENEIDSEGGNVGVSSNDGSVGDVGVSVVGDGARSVGVCSDGSLSV